MSTWKLVAHSIAIFVLGCVALAVALDGHWIAAVMISSATVALAW